MNMRIGPLMFASLVGYETGKGHYLIAFLILIMFVLLEVYYERRDNQ